MRPIARTFTYERIDMQERILDLLIDYPILWIVVMLLVPSAIGYRYRKFKRASQGANNLQAKILLVVGFAGAAIILWFVLQYT
jgi:uncharacterized membrane protein